LQIKAPEGCPFVFLTPERWELVKIKWQQFYKTGKADQWQNRHLMNNALLTFKRHCRWAGLEIASGEKIAIHNLRKGYAQNLADNGVSQPTLKKLMGHSSISTTDEFYLRSSDANERHACEALDNIMESETNYVSFTFSRTNHPQGVPTGNSNSIDTRELK